MSERQGVGFVRLKSHWQDVYRTKAPDEVSWYREHLDRSLELIRRTGIPRDARIIDVGGGASTLVDDLLEAGFENLTVLDVSGEALVVARRRLGADADRVQWIEADITEIDLGEDTFDLWHDRAALHFLIDGGDRRAYAGTLARAVAPGGHAILATFALEGPSRCSGLDVHRYDAPAVERLLGADFETRAVAKETHITPSGNRQRFMYVWIQHVPVPTDGENRVDA